MNDLVVSSAVRSLMLVEDKEDKELLLFVGIKKKKKKRVKEKKFLNIREGTKLKYPKL